MKKTLSIIITLLFLTNCSDKDQCECSPDNVCVTIINSTGESVKTVGLIYGKGIHSNNLASGQLATNNKTCLSFKCNGENTFHLTSILSTGDTVASPEEYSEGGYKFVGTITKDKIKIKLNESTY